jgi:hypothetical protein
LLSTHVAQKWHSRLRLGTREFTRFLAPDQGTLRATRFEGVPRDVQLLAERQTDAESSCEDDLQRTDFFCVANTHLCH